MESNPSFSLSSRRRWSMLALSMFAQISTGLIVTGPAFLIPVLHSERGLSLARAGLLVTAPNIGMMLTLIAWGAVVDRFGERWVLTIGGSLLGIVVKKRRLEWAGFMAAIWLPTHLLVAITRVIERSIRDLPAHVRTDPPPTAAMVPFAMVVFALLGSRVVDIVQAKRNPAG